MGSVAPTTATVSSTIAPVERAVAAVIVMVAAVCVRAIVGARGFVSVALAATTRAEGDAYEHQDNYHDHDKERTHVGSPR